MFYLTVLLVCLFFFGLIAYILNQNDILSTWIIALFMFAVSIFVCMLNISKWDVTIYPLTIIVIIFGMLFLGLGEVLGRNVYKKFTSSKVSQQLFNYKSIKINYLTTFFCCFIMLITTLVYFQYIYRASLVVGNTSGYSQMFEYARYAIINVKYNISEPSYLSHLLLMSKCISYIYIASILYNKVMFQTQEITYFFPVIIYIVQLSISTERIDFIRLIAYVLVLLFIFWKKKNLWNNNLDLRILVSGAIGIILFFLVFRLLGFLTSKSDSRELWDDLSNYTGSPIIALNDYLSKNKSENAFFGKETLFNLYTVLRGLGLSSIPEYNIPLEFYYYSFSSRTNIYTALRRCIQDYGYIGLYIIMTIEGLLYSFLLEKIKRSTVTLYTVMLFSSLFYPIVEIAIEERFISNLTSLSTIYQCLYLGLFYFLLIKRKNKDVYI